MVQPRGSVGLLILGISCVFIAVIVGACNPSVASQQDSGDAGTRNELAIQGIPKENDEPIGMKTEDCPSIDTSMKHSVAELRPHRVSLLALRWPILAGIASSLWSPLGALAGSAEKLPPFAAAAWIGFGYLEMALILAGLKNVARHVFGQDPVPVKREGSWKVVSLCFVAGVVWGMGTVMHYVGAISSGYAVAYGIAQCSPLVAALIGVLVFKEAPRSIALFRLMLLFYIGGVISLATASA
eukprot:TRINITY_DN2562_c1_g1_i1.p1 TRINITY_DN2562_c1_g1~~TRINITY_DN2562_c1_g1_i1.p1  ORF type:complete len:256 (-),score=22.68 TRINITY_DN2562_c1_g1_i1:429-1151(-)